MVEVKAYNSQVSLYPMEKDTENKQLRLSDKDTEMKSDIEKVVKHSNGRLTPMKKIRRTKSAGIF